MQALEILRQRTLEVATAAVTLDDIMQNGGDISFVSHLVTLMPASGQALCTTLDVVEAVLALRKAAEVVSAATRGPAATGLSESQTVIPPGQPNSAVQALTPGAAPNLPC